MRLFAGIFVVLMVSAEALANKPLLKNVLEGTRSKIISLQSELITTLKDQSKAQNQLTKLKELLKLQEQENKLATDRLKSLEKYIEELEHRRNLVLANIQQKQKTIERSLRSIEESRRNRATGFPLVEKESFEAPRRKVYQKLTQISLAELQALSVDLADSERLREQIDAEKQQVAAMVTDLEEQEGLLKFHRELQSEVLVRSREERIAQLENYRRLKEKETLVEDLLKDFNARMELVQIESDARADRKTALVMSESGFFKSKGQLPLPLKGRVLSEFGKVLDPVSRLHVFRKGIEIEADKRTEVRSIYSGKLVYSGLLKGYGRVAIVDHGGHYYSLLGHLGETLKKPGDPIAAGERIGHTDEAGTPLYFEIRVKNVAVNPLQWVVN